eukprot:scaffold1815_cov208-Amphora_coffeaeformis.AAC.7
MHACQDRRAYARRQSSFDGPSVCPLTLFDTLRFPPPLVGVWWSAVFVGRDRNAKGGSER